MYKVAAIGNFETTAYFGAAGFEVFSPNSRKDAEKLIKKLSESGFAVIFVAEEYYTNRFENSFLPAVIPLSVGEKSSAAERIRGYIKRAVGSDMNFDGQKGS